MFILKIFQRAVYIPRFNRKSIVCFFMIPIFIAISSKPSLSIELPEIIRSAEKLIEKNSMLAALDDFYSRYYDKTEFWDASEKYQQRFLHDYHSLLIKLAQESQNAQSRNSYLTESIKIAEFYIDDWYSQLDETKKKKYEKYATRKIFHIADSYKAMGKYENAVNNLETLSVNYISLFRPEVITKVWDHLLRRYPQYNIKDKNSIKRIKDMIQRDIDCKQRWANYVYFLFDLRDVPPMKRFAKQKLREYESLLGLYNV